MTLDARGRLDLKAMPKIELHAHLSGSISRQALHEVWSWKTSEKDDSTLRDPLVELPEGKHDFDLKVFFQLFTTYIYNLVNNERAITYTTKCVLEAFQDDGVCYLELRTTPRHIPAADSTHEITPERYIYLIAATIAQFEALNTTTIRTKLILSIDRRHSRDQAERTLEIALANQPLVVGLDLCGDPREGEISIFNHVFERAKRSGLGITVHFAEIPQSINQNLTTELETMLKWEPDRLGHVIHVPIEVKKVITERQLGLELCLTCNIQAKMISTDATFTSHHFGEWWDGGNFKCPIILGTDDIAIFGSSLSQEYELIREHFNFTDDNLLRLASSGISKIFGNEEDATWLASLFSDAMERYKSTAVSESKTDPSRFVM